MIFSKLSVLIQNHSIYKKMRENIALPVVLILSRLSIFISIGYFMVDYFDLHFLIEFLDVKSFDPHFSVSSVLMSTFYMYFIFKIDM